MKNRTKFKFLLVALSSAFFFNSVQAQFSFSPSTLLIKNQVLDTMTYDSIRINNISSSNLMLNWELISYDTSGGSYFDFCASGNCYIGIPDTGSFPDIATTQFGYIGAHFWTGSTAASCTTQVRVFDEKDPTKRDTITFILNAVLSGIDENELNSQVSIGPNPTKGTVRIETAMQTLTGISVFNIAGERVFVSACNARVNFLDLGTLPKGIYFIQAESGKASVFRKIILAD